MLYKKQRQSEYSVCYEGSEGDTIRLLKQNTVETVVLLSDKKVDGHINMNLHPHAVCSADAIT